MDFKSWIFKFWSPNTCDGCETHAIVINRWHFWQNLQQVVENYTYNYSHKNLILGKDIYLSDDSDEKQPSVLTIGLDPENEFKVYAQLKVPKKIFNIILSDTELKQLLDFLEEDSRYIFRKVNDSVTIQHCFNLHVFGGKMDATNIKRSEYSIDCNTLKSLHRERARIKQYISEVECQTHLQQSNFFELLTRFYHGKTIQEAFDLSKTEHLQEFFDQQLEMCPEFVFEISTNFEKFFVKCLPYFIKTIMLHESARLQTFFKDWPHNHNSISIMDMAMSGLYFTGKEDKVNCAFCSVEIHKWTPGDDPIADHHKFSRQCCLLRDPNSTLNVSDVNANEKLEHKLSHLSKYCVDEVNFE